MKRFAINLYSRVILSIFLLMVVWWVFTTVKHSQDTTQNFLFGAMLGILPIIGGVFGVTNGKKWGWLRSSVGRTLLFLSAGLITWGIGTLIFAYYNIFLQVAVPYPSWADALYILSWPLWVVGILNMSKATGAKFQLKSIMGRSLLFAIPASAIILSYYVLIIVAREGIISVPGGAMKTFFDLAYPIGDVFILTTTLLVYGLSFNYLGGFFKWPVIVILAGFVINYIGDSTFVYTTTRETYFVASWIDLIYTIAFAFISFGVTLMDPHSSLEDA